MILFIIIFIVTQCETIKREKKLSLSLTQHMLFAYTKHVHIYTNAKFLIHDNIHASSSIIQIAYITARVLLILIKKMENVTVCYFDIYITVVSHILCLFVCVCV